MTGRAPPRSEGCLSDLQLDRLMVGELKRSSVAAHLLACERCRGRLAELERDAKEFDASKYLPRAQGSRRWPWAAGALLAAAAGLLLMLRPASDDGVRWKGGFQLALIARHADSGRVERVLPGAQLSPDDAIRFGVTSDQAGWLVVLGVDAAGQVTPYAPVSGNALELAPTTRERILDGSIVLDRTLGPERVLALSCAQPIAVERAVDAARQALERVGKDPRRVADLGLGCRQSAALFIKVARP